MTGGFRPQDAVSICDQAGAEIARGLCIWDSRDLASCNTSNAADGARRSSGAAAGTAAGAGRAACDASVQVSRRAIAEQAADKPPAKADGASIPAAASPRRPAATAAQLWAGRGSAHGSGEFAAGEGVHGAAPADRVAVRREDMVMMTAGGAALGVTDSAE